MKPIFRRAILLTAALMAAPAVQAAAAEDFYKGKTLTILVGYGPGTGYDVYARALARHFKTHFPGSPNVVVQNMPGAGGMAMVNHLYNVAPRDGSVIALPPPVVLFEPLYGNAEAKFDTRNFSWIGSITKDLTPLCLSWHDSKIKTYEDALKQESLVGATGKAANSYIYPQILNATLGTKFKVVLGYTDSGEVGLAMERGEIEGYCSFTLGSIKASRPDWLNKKQVNILLQLTLKKDPSLGNVPGLLDVAKDDTLRQIFEVVFGWSDMNRPVMAPMEVPADRIQVLRKVFDATMKDPAFLEDAKKQNLDVDPITGSEVADIVNRIYATPPSVIARVTAVREK